MDKEMDKTVKEYGFDSMTEWSRLVAHADLSSAEKLKAFEDWKYNDGTKDGLLKLKELI